MKDKAARLKAVEDKSARLLNQIAKILELHKPQTTQPTRLTAN